jgi:hypothetical protein
MSVDLIWVIGVACVGIAAVSLTVSIITLRNVAALRRAIRGDANRPGDANSPAAMEGAEESGNVFCRGCGGMYDSIHTACPSCHTPRG